MYFEDSDEGSVVIQMVGESFFFFAGELFFFSISFFKSYLYGMVIYYEGNVGKVGKNLLGVFSSFGIGP